MLKELLKYFLFLSSLATAAQPLTKPDGSQWWKETVFYEIYMPSFQDSDGNGYSDFNGMTSRLDYLQDIGIKGIWLTPFLVSPKVDNGYDVADYYAVDPVYGSLDHFKTFLAESHKRGIKVIMDMVLNHTSTECSWFKESRKSRDNPYRDYYIWRDHPNNWESFFGGSAWKEDSLTHQYYYHKFDYRMADLNWSNPKVVEEIQKVLRYWLSLGVDGFRLDVINFLTTDGITSDNPLVNGKQEHSFDISQPGVINAIQLIKATVNEFPNRFVVGEIGSDKLDVLAKYQSPELMDVVFNFNFGSMPSFSVSRIFDELQKMDQQQAGFPTLFFGSHDMPRLMDRLAGGEPARAKALAALMLTAKGVPFVYYGEEIGMQNITANTPGEIIDIQGKTHYQLALQEGKSPGEALRIGNENNRDKSRSPMQWDNSLNAGFTLGKPWIKVSESYKRMNVQQSQKDTNSLLNTYKALLALRNNEKALQYGTYEQLELKNDMISFTREYQSDRIAVFINFGNATTIQLPSNAKILRGNSTLEKNSFLIYLNP
ncbi:MAG: alpha-glucosidase [Bacteroidetes bacterium]|nr:alpha-glucosidase [Bacteroidota bacterium]